MVVHPFARQREERIELVAHCQDCGTGIGGTRMGRQRPHLTARIVVRLDEGYLAACMCQTDGCG